MKQVWKIGKSTRFENLSDEFLWLKEAGVAIPSYCVEEPVSPLKLARKPSLFKLFSNDVGLLAAQYMDGIQLEILNGEKSVNFGSVYENAVVQELTAHGLEPYYFNSKRQGELDFVLEIGGKVLLVEVKSGKDYIKHAALANVMASSAYDIQEAIVLCNANIRFATPTSGKKDELSMRQSIWHNSCGPTRCRSR